MANRVTTGLVRSHEKVGLMGLATRRLADAAGDLLAHIGLRAARDLTFLEQVRRSTPQTPATEMMINALAQDYMATTTQIYHQANSQLLREQCRFEQELTLSDYELNDPTYTTLTRQLSSGR